VSSKSASDHDSQSDEDSVPLQQLAEWPITGMGLHPGGSNYVFVVRLTDPVKYPELLDQNPSFSESTSETPDTPEQDGVVPDEIDESASTNPNPENDRSGIFRVAHFTTENEPPIWFHVNWAGLTSLQPSSEQAHTAKGVCSYLSMPLLFQIIESQKTTSLSATNVSKIFMTWRCSMPSYTMLIARAVRA